MARKWDVFALFCHPWRIEGGATGEEKLFADALEIRQSGEGNLLFDDTIATPDAALVVTPAAGRQDNRA